MKIMPILTTPSTPPFVAVLAYDGLCMFEFGLAVELFGLPRPEFGDRWYRFQVCAERPGPLTATGGVAVMADAGIDALGDADTIVIPGWRGLDAPVPDALVTILRTAYTRGARLVSICSGVFVLAATGLLDGRRATTHWRYTDRLTQRYPRIRVEPDVLYTEDDRLFTSAGSAAGLDLGLHLIRRDFGAEIANQVARRLVLPAHREGGQAQFIDRPLADREGARLSDVLDWARAHLGERLTIDLLADRAAMSRRSFIRRFEAATGEAPGAWVIGERIRWACDLLETTLLPIERIATDCGFGSADALRHHFRIRIGVSPGVYRRSFARRPDAA